MPADQSGKIPSDSTEYRNESQSNLDILLSTEPVITNQSTVQFSVTNQTSIFRPLASNPPANIIRTTAQEGRRRRRQRCRQRRQQRRREQRRVEEERRQQERLERERRQQHRLERQRRRKQQWESRQQERFRFSAVNGETSDKLTPKPDVSHLVEILVGRPKSRHYYNRYLRFDESDSETSKEEQLEAYDAEKIDPKERWEQEQISSLEGFVVLEHLAQLQEEQQQLQQIDSVQDILEEEEEHRNLVQLTKKELWEQMELCAQQLSESWA